MRTVLFGLALWFTCPAAPTPDPQVVMPPSAAHPQSWLDPPNRLKPPFPDNPKPGYPGTSAGSLSEFVAPEVISKIVVAQYAGSADDVRRYLTAIPTAAARYFGPSLELCAPPAGSRTGAALAWTSTSTLTFESGRSARLAVAAVYVARYMVADPPGLAAIKVFGLSQGPGCVGFDKVPVDSLYASYVDPDGYSWFFAIPLQRKNQLAPEF